MPYGDRPRIRIWEVFLYVAGTILLILYAVTALASDDLMWFLPQSDMPAPTRVVIHRAGVEKTLVAGDDGFDAISRAAREAFANTDNPSLINVGLSDVTLERFWTQFTVVEFFYGEPLEFHVPFQAGNPTQLLFPIEGAHSGGGLFFRGAQGQYWFGAMRVKEPNLILDAVRPLL